MSITISLDPQQSSVVTQTGLPVQVRDPSGSVLGQIVPCLQQDGRARRPDNDRSSGEDRWIACWDEWYSESEDDELEMPETD